jgi:hypothetical protein
VIDKDRLAKTVSANDALLDDGMPFEYVMQHMNVDMEGAEYVAEQRSLRLLKIRSGMPFELDTGITILALLSAAWMDGLATGLTVQIQDPGERSENDSME